MAKEFIAGVSFTGTTTQIAVLEIRNGEASIATVEEFRNETKNEFWYLEPLLAKSKKIFKKISKVSVAFDNAALFMHSFPADSALSQVDRQEHVRWELSNYIPDFHPQEYVNDLHILRTHVQEQVVDLFVVSAKRSLLHQLQSALSAGHYELHVVDTNHFSSQYSLLVNYPEIKTASVVLVAMNGNRIDAGALRNGRLTNYQYTAVTSVDEICGYLQLYVEDILPGVELFVCGTAVSNELIAAIKEKMNITATKLNPFRKMPVQSSFDGDSVIGQEHRFAACVGIALRKQ